MIKLETPRGLPVNVPENSSEDISPKFNITDSQEIVRYYQENGYVVIKGLISASDCDQARSLWNSQIKPYKGFIYRQATAKAEKHVFNGNGWVMNPILNLQSLDPAHFKEFREHTTKQFLASTPLKTAFTMLLSSTPRIVQSMYFEGNSATWEHQDSYYLDSETSGEMAAAWVAVEDISAKAGRFFICPKSHKIKLDDHSLYNNIAENHEGYILSVVEKIRRENLEIRAPALEKGDVLFWNSWTIHGSLNSQDSMHSRSSITCHAIPKGKRMRQYQTRLIDVSTDELNGVEIHRRKDLSQLRNKAILFFESTFPTAFYWTKKQAILYVLQKKDQQS